MRRSQPGERLSQLLDAATRVFMRLGYRRARVAGIAREMGVAPGTVYLYVESKEALFALVLQRALGEEDLPADLPVPSPALGALLEYVRRQCFHTGQLPALAQALAGEPPADARAEFEAIIRELYAWINQRWQALQLLARSAEDWPELADVYYHQERRRLIQVLTDYLDRRIGPRRLRSMPDTVTAARLILETIAWFAYHRYTDRDASLISEKMARETVVTVLVNAFTFDEAKNRG